MKVNSPVGPAASASSSAALESDRHALARLLSRDPDHAVAEVRAPDLDSARSTI
jgi:hypothetical protein